MPEKTDLQVIAEVKNGDKAAFNLLVLKYQYKICRVIARYIADPEEALDLTQEIFIKVYNSLANFRGDSSFYTWLYKIAINTAKNQNISQNAKQCLKNFDVYDLEKTIYNLSDSDTPEKILISKQTEEKIYQVIENLPVELKTAIMLREIEGFSYDDIAIIIDAPIGTVRSRIHRAREFIMQTLKNSNNK